MMAWWQHSWAGNNGEKWQKIIFRTNNWKARKSGKMGFWWPHEAFLPWISVPRHTSIHKNKQHVAVVGLVLSRQLLEWKKRHSWNLRANKVQRSEPSSQFLPFLHILRILRTPMGHPMASVHHVWVQAGVWSIVALISGEIARTFSFFSLFLRDQWLVILTKKVIFEGEGGGGGRPQGLR